MTEKILKQMYNGRGITCKLLDFIISSVYEDRAAHRQFMEQLSAEYGRFLGRLHLNIRPLGTLGILPYKLLTKPVLVEKDFKTFYWCYQNTHQCEMFTEKIFPNLVKDNPVTPMFSVQMWDFLYSHIGDVWLKFIFREGSLFISFPRNCLLQITGSSAIEVYYKNLNIEKRKRKLQFEEASVCKRLKTCDDAGTTNVISAPTVNFHGTRLTVELTKMLYSKNVVMSFPRVHAVEQLQDECPDEANKFITIIFQNAKNVLKTPASEEIVLKNSTVALLRNETTIKIVQSFMKNHRKIHFLEMMMVHCPSDEKITATSYCSPKQICSFMSAVIHRVIPPELLGSKHNKGKMQDFCKVFVNASKGDHLSLEHLLYCMHIDDCHWIPEGISREERQITFAIAMNWLFADYLPAVLQGFFYITDFEGQKKRLFFYRKDVWRILETRLTMQLVCGKIILDERHKMQSQITTANRELFSCTGGGRLLPKKVRSRLIMNLKPSKELSSKLKNYLCVLNFIADRKFGERNNLTGCSMSCLPDFHKLWRGFVESHRVDGKLVCQTPLYFVKLDIFDCFSSVKLNLMDKVLREACQFAELNGVQQVRVHTCFTVSMASGRLLHQFKQMILPENGCFLTHLKNAGHSGNVLVVRDGCETVSIRQMTEDLIFYLKNVSFRLGKLNFRLTQGLGQGSLLSPILSNLYYGHMENCHLGEFIPMRGGELLVRYVDDYFLVSPERERALKFLSILHPGVPEYNCGTSCTKVVKNFDTEPNQENRCKTCAEKGINLIPWLGLLINSRTLEITGDFSQYANHSIAHTMTLDASLGKNGLKKKMIFLIAPGNQCILFDRKVNSKKTIVRNLYEYALLTAFRMHSLSTKLSKSEGADKHPDFYAELVLACVNQICVSLYKLKSRDMIVYPLRNCVSKFICLQAFIAKLKRHEMKYHEVLKRITPKSNDFAVKIGQYTLAYFQRAIEPRMPPVFKEIQV